MKEVREALTVTAVIAEGKVVKVLANCGDRGASISWHCEPSAAPRVGESVAIRLVDLPRDRTALQVLGLAQ